MNSNANNENQVVEVILKNVPSYVNILVEARSSSHLAEWTLVDYNKAVSWSEYFEKASAIPHVVNPLNERFKNTIKNLPGDNSNIASKSLSQSRYLLYELLLGNSHIPKDLFIQVVLDCFSSSKSPAIGASIQTMKANAHSKAIENILLEMHSIVDEAEADSKQKEVESEPTMEDSANRYLNSPETLRKRANAKFIVSTLPSLLDPSATPSKWFLDVVRQHLSSLVVLETVCWILTTFSESSNTCSELVRLLATISDKDFFSIHGWLLSEVSKKHFKFFEAHLAKLLTHLQHSSKPCNLGPLCNNATLKLHFQFLATDPRVKSVLELIAAKYEYVHAFFTKEHIP